MSTDDQSKPVWKELLSKRSSTKGQIIKFKNYLERLSGLPKLSDLEIIELNLKIMKFEGLSAKFDDLQTEIEIQNSHNLQTETEERDRIETDIIQCMAIAKILIKSNEAADDAERRRSSCHFSGSDFQDLGFKLPQIQVSKFDGSYFRWLEFRDTFLNLIHNNERIPDIHKFHYLCSYLEGNAARIISNLEVSSDNYKEAWTLLCERYDNKRILINHHLDSLINIQPVTRESENSLRFLVDHMTKNLRALASLGQPTQHWDALVIFIMSSKLDSRTTTKWEECRNTLYTDVPTLDQFKQFLIDRADVLETLNRNKGVYNNNNTTYNPSKSQSVSRYSNNSNSSSSQNNNNNFNKRNQTQYTKSFASINNNQSSSTTYLCVICNGNHKIYDCATFKSKGLKERLNYVSKYKLCANCLRQGHPISECRMGPCRQCNQRHNSLLHNPNVSVTCTIECDQNPSSLVSFSKQNSAQVLLSTATIEVCNPVNNKREQVRALLDCGSQSSFVTKSLQQKLSLKTNPLQAINVIGIGNNCTNQVVEGCVAELKSINSSFHVTLSCYVLDELTGNLPKVSINKQNLPIPNCITLADPKFDQPAPIDVLIGADLFWDILESEQRSLGPNNPKLQKSKFGWIVAGPMSQANPNNKIHCNHAVISNPIIDEMLPKFWELEELPQKKILSPNETACEKHFLMNTTRLNTGRFSVKLPLKDSPDCLGDSYYLAKKRFLNLEKRFRQNPELKAQYVEFISEYEELGHLSESSVLVTNSSYFLCHHAVLKEESETTKLRVVFDGSAATTSSGFSLNDVLLVGPNMQDSLFSILIRARQYQYILTGDIAKMYRQVEVSEEDRNLQLILWRENESQPIKTLRLGTVTYGTASASYLSTRCLWQVGEECPDEFIKNIIQNDFYVDDLITGCDSESKLQYIQNSVSKALNSGCFQLRKYKTNSKILFQNEDQNTTLNNKEKLIFSESSSTLGLGWDPSSDQLHFPVKKIDVKNDKITKRHILSNSFRIFDPLGLLSPFIIQPKMLLQKLWQAGLEWDEPVSQDVRDEWIKIANDLPIIADLAIPRKVLCESPSTVELHSFSDASQRAYGACIYLKSIQGDRVTVRLLCSKSKVVPLKPTTIPRLELCAALLAAKLCKSVLDSIRYTSKRVVHWCDSSVVIGWLNSTPSKLKTFVANRVGEILELTNPKSWNYVPTDANPADLISRGVSANLLRDSTLWWSGPAYLQKDESEWPKLKSKQLPTLLELPEVRVHSAETEELTFNLNNYSNFTKLQRIFAFVLRFIHNCKSKNKLIGILNVDELDNSFNLLCRVSQKQSFDSEYKLLYENKPLKPKSNILSLSPFFDTKNNLMRVGGRLNASNYDYEKRHPILLNSSHHLTKLLFEREHLRNMHAGPQLLLSTLREFIWPVNGRKLARSVVKNCVTCTRIRGQTMNPKMGNLPSYRVSVDFPFKSVGIDYAVPFFILNRKGRGAKLIKCYLCLFICLRFKCLHLEAVSDLTKEAFIMTFRRFIARRGKPAEVYSDNGRNFVAAAKEINLFLKSNNESLSEFAVQEGIKFTFIPAYAPHFGGIWEAGVKSAKYHIKRVMGNSHLTFEEISTLFAQVEAILNSRPLCPMSSSPTDFLSLSPGHFLVGRPLNALPWSNLEDKKETGLQRYARLEKLRQHFWKRWQKEYITELQQRTKWKSDKTKLNVGDMVLLQEANVPPLSWHLGRVARLFPGADGITRVADVNTTKGCVRRPLVRLCPLPTVEELQA